MTIFVDKIQAALQVFVKACALEEKLQEHAGKVSFVSSEEMEITVKEALSRPVVRGKNIRSHLLRLMNLRAHCKSADLKSLVVARGSHMALA